VTNHRGNQRFFYCTQRRNWASLHRPCTLVCGQSSHWSSGGYFLSVKSCSIAFKNFNASVYDVSCSLEVQVSSFYELVIHPLQREVVSLHFNLSTIIVRKNFIHAIDISPTSCDSLTEVFFADNNFFPSWTTAMQPSSSYHGFAPTIRSMPLSLQGQILLPILSFSASQDALHFSQLTTSY